VAKHLALVKQQARMTFSLRTKRLGGQGNLSVYHLLFTKNRMKEEVLILIGQQCVNEKTRNLFKGEIKEKSKRIYVKQLETIAENQGIDTDKLYRKITEEVLENYAQQYYKTT
jgi:hypothetical protein